MFFRPAPTLRSDPGVLVTKPLRNFQKALCFIKNHELKDFHKTCFSTMDDCIKVMTNQQPSIRARINRETEKQIAANRQMLHSII